LHDGVVLYAAGEHRMFQEDGSNSSVTPSWRKCWQQSFEFP